MVVGFCLVKSLPNWGGKSIKIEEDGPQSHWVDSFGDPFKILKCPMLF